MAYVGPHLVRSRRVPCLPRRSGTGKGLSAKNAIDSCPGRASANVVRVSIKGSAYGNFQSGAEDRQPDRHPGCRRRAASGQPRRRPSVCLLLAEHEPEQLERAAPRWLGRHRLDARRHARSRAGGSRSFFSPRRRFPRCGGHSSQFLDAVSGASSGFMSSHGGVLGVVVPCCRKGAAISKRRAARPCSNPCPDRRPTTVSYPQALGGTGGRQRLELLRPRCPASSAQSERAARMKVT